MPSTAKALGVDPTNPAQSADKAMGYLAQLFKKFGDWKKAVWAYNWGEGNVAKYLAGRKTSRRNPQIWPDRGGWLHQ
jgi:soluble lytic murein transglycosylase-like protein